jgi:hypothetical protein
MKRKKVISMFLAIFGVMFLCASSNLFADRLDEGTDFWFAIPQFQRIKSSDEVPIGASPYNLFITSKVSTTARIYSGDGNLYQTIPLVANKSQVIYLKEIMFNENEAVGDAKYSFHVESDDPIALVVYIAWKYTGETFKLIPTEGLGRDYYTFNLYADWARHASSNTGDNFNPVTDSYNPPQIMIVAAEDNTVVNYTPPVETDSVHAYKTGSVNLNKGEVFFIKTKTLATPKVYQVLAKNDDLTGTHISSNKKIAVFSGHTKGSYPGVPLTLYNHTLKTNFLKNLLMETALSTENLGSEYVFVPFDYQGTRPLDVKDTIGYQFYGDLLRMIAVESGTTSIYKKNSDGTSTFLKALNQGEILDIESAVSPCVYFSDNNKKFAVAQFGKCWWNWLGGDINYKNDLEIDNKDDELLNPSHSGNGQMNILLASGNSSSSAEFYSPNNLDNNYCTIIFKTGSEKNIQMYGDGETSGATLSDKFPERIKRIPGTNYSYVSCIVNTGGHYLKSLTTDINDRFQVYAYGKTDGFKTGFAYSYPANCGNNSACADSVIVKDTVAPASVFGAVEVIKLDPNAICAKLSDIFAGKDSQNAELKVTREKGASVANFQVKFINPFLDGNLTLNAVAKSGKIFTKKYTYDAARLAVSPNELKFDNLDKNQVKTLSVTISNNGKNDFTLDSVYLDDASNKIYSLATNNNLKNIKIKAGENFKIDVQAVISNSSDYAVVGTLKCGIFGGPYNLCRLTADFGKARIFAEDYDFGNVADDRMNNSKWIKIQNTSSSELRITNIAVDELTPNAKSCFIINLPELTKDSALIIPPYRTTYYKVNCVLKSKNMDTSAIRIVFTSNSESGDNVSLISAFNKAGSTFPKRLNFAACRALGGWTNENNIHYYEQNLTVYGNKMTSKSFAGAEIVGDGAFEIDPVSLQDLKNNPLAANDSTTLKIRFKPTRLGYFSAQIKLLDFSDGGINVVSGYAYSPNIKYSNLDFGSVSKSSGLTKDSFLIIESNSSKETFVSDLEIYSVAISGPDSANFFIDPAFELPSKQKPIVLNPGTDLRLPIRFKTEAPRKTPFIANIRINSNVDKENDVSSVFLTATTETSTVYVNGVDFNRGVIGLDTLTNKMEIVNNSSSEIYLTKSLRSSISQTQTLNKCYITKAYLASSNKPASIDENNIVIPSMDKLDIEIKFIPIETGEITLRSDIEYTIGANSIEKMTAVGVIRAVGVKYGVNASIDKTDLTFAKSLSEAFIAVRLKSDLIEKRPLEDLKIDRFQLTVDFEKFQAENYVSPRTWDDNFIQTAESMLKDWNLESKIYKSGSLILVFKANNNSNYLSNKQFDLLCKFKIELKPESKLENLIVNSLLGVDFVNLSASAPITKVNNILGELILTPSALADVAFEQNSETENLIYPNPSSGRINIQYRVNKANRIQIFLYSETGEKIGELLNIAKDAGKYTETFDLKKYGLAPGAYYITYIEGDESRVFKLNYK